MIFVFSNLQLLESLELIQMVRGPTHISGNALDLLITNSDDTTYITLPRSFFDHFSLLFFITVDHLPADDVSICFFKSFVHLGTLNSNFSLLYSFISSCLTYDEDHLANCFALFTQSIYDFNPIKHSRRVTLLVYHSSHTMHLINMRNTSRRKISKSWSLHESLEMITFLSTLIIQ